jgi:hypothetical protein
MSGLPCYVLADVQRRPDASPTALDPMAPATLPPPPERLQTALKRLRWTYGTLAIELRTSPSTTRNWGLGRSPVPPALLAWLEGLAAFHHAHPAPPLREREA